MLRNVTLSLDRDKWIWKFSREGNFLVTSSYLVHSINLISSSATLLEEIILLYFIYTI